MVYYTTHVMMLWLEGEPFHTSNDMKISAYIDPGQSRSLRVLELTGSQISDLDALGGNISYL